MGRFMGGVVHAEPTFHGPRPGPANQTLGYRTEAARPITFSTFSTQPGPPHFQNTARPGSSMFSDRPGPDHRLMTSPANVSPVEEGI